MDTRTPCVVNDNVETIPSVLNERGMPCSCGIHATYHDEQNPRTRQRLRQPRKIYLQGGRGEGTRLSVWNELLSEFRALGGTAENVRLGTGRFGRGLFAAEPGRPLVLHAPENLLVATADIRFEHGALKIAPDAPVGPRERRFFEDYHAELSWGGGGRAEIERIFADARSLPDSLRRALSARYRCGPWFEDPSPM